MEPKNAIIKLKIFTWDSIFFLLLCTLEINVGGASQDVSAVNGRRQLADGAIESRLYSRATTIAKSNTNISLLKPGDGRFICPDRKDDAQ